MFASPAVLNSYGWPSRDAYRPLEKPSITGFCADERTRSAKRQTPWSSNQHRTNVVVSASIVQSVETPAQRRDLEMLSQATKVSQGSLGLTHPHPNHGCVLLSASGHVISEAFHRAQGATSAEQLACSAAGEGARGGTAYLNLETGDCHGDTLSLEALLQSGVSRVVVGMRNPLPHMRGAGVALLRASGVKVEVLEDHPNVLAESSSQHTAFRACLSANEPLLHRAALGQPMSILKYAMTLDGKIAATTGHSAWVSNSTSRARVFEQRACSDVVIVGGNTLRRDNPRLTTRRDYGHQPARIVMSRTLDLPQDANLWDVSTAPTIVMTQQGARKDFQHLLRSKGVEVVEFDFLTPANVAAYCFDRGFMQCFWECGGTLAAPAISSGTIHRVMSFIAPKIIGGTRAPTPVGNLGFVEMTQAVNLVDVAYDVLDGDLLVTGALPSSGGLLELHKKTKEKKCAQAPKQLRASALRATRDAVLGADQQGAAAAASLATVDPEADDPCTAEFYKAWDQWGCLSNFSPHPIDMPQGKGPQAYDRSMSGPRCRWASVEHYYQAQKFWCTIGGPSDSEDELEEASCSEVSMTIIDAILAAESPEEAARIGRYHQLQHPELVRKDWVHAKVEIMLEALRAKFSTHAGPQSMLLSTADGGAGHCAQGALELVEASPHDFFWGRGRNGTGENRLGRLLMQVREELAQSIDQGASSLRDDARTDSL